MTQRIDYQSPATPGPSGRGGRTIFGWVLFIGLGIMLFLLLNQRRQPYDPLPLSSFRDLLQANAVAKVTVEGDELYGQLLPNPQTPIVNFRTELPEGTSASWAFTQWLLDNRGNAIVDARNDTNLLARILLPLVPWILIFGFIWFFVFRNLRQASQRNEPVRVVIVGTEPPPPSPPPVASVAQGGA